MITRRVIGLITLGIIIIIGTIFYVIARNKVKAVESDNLIMEKNDLKGKI